MRRRYGSMTYMDPTMDEIDVIRKVPEVFEILQHKVAAAIRRDGGEPVLDGVVSIYKAKETGTAPFTEDGCMIGASCAVKMYGEFPD